MYNRTYWKDHIVDEETDEVLQQGTLQDAEHFNNMEEGIFAAHEMAAANAEALGKQKRAVESLDGEIIQVTLTNSLAYPFNNSQQTVALAAQRNTPAYVVITEVKSFVGNVGEIVVTDILANGFKIAFTGSAKSVTVEYKILGGYTR